MLLYHGSRKQFSLFDSRFYRTGEGVGDYIGWYFCSTPKGALYHCEKYLECRPYGEGGYIFCCEVDDKYVDIDIDGCYTEFPYGRPIFGVTLENSHQIKIINTVPALNIFVDVYGDPYKFSS
jgi:hypothetical protein